MSNGENNSSQVIRGDGGSQCAADAELYIVQSEIFLLENMYVDTAMALSIEYIQKKKTRKKKRKRRRKGDEKKKKTKRED